MTLPVPDTIFALSSGGLPAAIAIVRISGPRAKQTLASLTSDRVPPPRRAVTRRLTDPSGRLLDRGLVLWLPGPETATGEDIAELHLHGSRAVVSTMLAELEARPGLRLAEPGEFTRQAYRNGRLDLDEAAGLADLLEAETEDQRRDAMIRVEGGIRALLVDWRDQTLELCARAEAAIDYEEDQFLPPDDTLVRDVNAFAAKIRSSLEGGTVERRAHGYRVLIAGPPNAGKSSLINYLSSRDVSIVTDEEGTTRDLIEVPLRIGHHAFTLIDSAGLREGATVVERIGIERTMKALEATDLILWLGDEPLEDAAAQVVHLHGRSDVAGREEMPSTADLSISVKTGAGIDTLKALLVDAAGAKLSSPSLIPQESRVYDAASRCVNLLVNETDDVVLIAENLRLARETLNRVDPRVGTEEMLDRLFARFCVGK